MEGERERGGGAFRYCHRWFCTMKVTKTISSKCSSQEI
jgi:hypothetical protein